jgi:hypothetical protein
MLYENSMSDVDESADENDSSREDLITSNGPDEDEVKHDPFEFPHDHEIPFSRLLFDPMVWQVQGSDNGDTNPNIPLLDDDVPMFDVPPPPPINMNTPLDQIIIPQMDTQQTLNNIEDIQMDPFINPPHIVIDDIGDITLEPSVGMYH